MVTMVSNDADLAEITAIIALKWINKKGWDDCILLSYFMIAVTNINGEAKIKDRYTNATRCKTVLQEGPVKLVQKVERDQTREADVLAKS